MQSGEFRISDGADRGQRVSCTRRRVFRPNAPAEHAASSGNVRSIGAQRFGGAGLARIGNTLIRLPRASFQQRWTTARTDTAESFITDFPDQNRFHGSTPCALATPRPTSPDDLSLGTTLGSSSRRTPTGVPSQRASSGLVAGRGIGAEEQSVKSVLNPGNP